MNSQINGANEQLENAFQLFNQFSEKLADSYSDLESHVAQLTDELAEARNERLIQLAEKEVLAKRLEGLLDALPAGIVVLDADGCITQTNPIAREMLGLDVSDKNIKGKQWESIAANKFITDGDELRLKDGRWVNVSACPLEDDPGKIILISDISETHTLQSMLNRQQRLSSLGEMVASLAHQIRTPLSSALLYLSTLDHPKNKAKDRLRFAEKARERLHHLERMVNDMLVFARGDVLQSEQINAAEFVNQVIKLLALSYSEDQITLVIDRDLNNVTIRANRDALLSAMQNIIDNAIEASGESPKIEISAYLNNEEQFEINIKDNGCGMSEEIKERVIEPFFTTRSNGTGLGLAVVSATVNRYAGDMTIHSKEAQGCMFAIKFPCAEVSGMLPSNLTRKEKGQSQVGLLKAFNNHVSVNKAVKTKLKAIEIHEVEL